MCEVFGSDDDYEWNGMSVRVEKVVAAFAYLTPFSLFATVVLVARSRKEEAMLAYTLKPRDRVEAQSREVWHQT